MSVEYLKNIIKNFIDNWCLHHIITKDTHETIALLFWQRIIAIDKENINGHKNKTKFKFKLKPGLENQLSYEKLFKRKHEKIINKRT